LPVSMPSAARLVVSLAPNSVLAKDSRGREYLRIIYGPEYTVREHLERLRERGLSSKRSLALREFALGIEGLERFVQRNRCDVCTSAYSVSSLWRASPSIRGCSETNRRAHHA
jgi:PNKP adenylyltransferase domain, ligase domain